MKRPFNLKDAFLKRQEETSGSYDAKVMAETITEDAGLDLPEELTVELVEANQSFGRKSRYKGLRIRTTVGYSNHFRRGVNFKEEKEKPGEVLASKGGWVDLDVLEAKIAEVAEAQKKAEELKKRERERRDRMRNHRNEIKAVGEEVLGEEDRFAASISPGGSQIEVRVKTVEEARLVFETAKKIREQRREAERQEAEAHV